MKKTLTLSLAAMVMACLAPFASAGPILLDHIDVFEKVSKDETHTVTHDLRPEIPNLYQATSGLLTLFFTDDALFDGGEKAEINIADFSTSQSISVNLLIFGLTVDALIDLNTDGLLDVSVTSTKGDFWWKTSSLAVLTKKAEVPEPGTLALLGLGLMGLGLARRRAAA